MYKQSASPLWDNVMSHTLSTSVRWWLSYMQTMPVTEVALKQAERPVVRLWTDAAGANRKVAAVLEVNGHFSTR